MNYFTETTSTSLGGNLLNSLKGILVGILLLVGSIYLLSYNEHRSINQALALEEMQEKIVLVDRPQYKVEYEKQPILIYGDVVPINPLEDTLFGIKSNELGLERNVEMYQWVEHVSSRDEKQVGGSTETVTTYEYEKAWRSTEEDSRLFRYPENHANPKMKYKSKTFSTDANLGEFYLSESIVTQFSNSSDYNGLATMPDQILDMTNHKTFLYKGKTADEPEIGDLKITYTQTEKGIYTLAGMTKGKTFGAYKSSNDRSLLFTRVGQVEASTIFEEEFKANTMLTWLFRAIGLLLMFFGFMLIMNLLVAIANILPIFGSLVEGVTALIAGALTLVLGSGVIAIAWFASRPMLSLSILGVGISLAILVFLLKKK
ncbi:MAG: Unknown protein [uncultured Sulfurovum sp.]|uniref:Uncharacterized protein n=1 Tax=uncultured Sulfurovum sp. TaxID=269237 RepID=A0A6S6U5R2_9BACT|nr:MAG: Unknown protein [uncultured Sulfurovum sp.]